MILDVTNSTNLLATVGHQFLMEGCRVSYPIGSSSAVLIDERILVVIKMATDIFHDNASQFTATQEWIDTYDQFSLSYHVFVACFCRKEKRFCTLSWAEFKKMRNDRLQSMKIEGENQFPFRVEVTSKKSFRAYALGGGRKSKKVGLVKKSTGLIIKEIRKLINS
ncbi:hypothetical protein D0C16_11585 [Cellvibrio sp. KY-GH-1]|uniref:hypothetical protein n=1 Tax=Cellvibrio sp. KY-GH-1 TaxID=2303332 RepID=UPI0012479D31|nr:hypothetical protein [Cellvibrio sp. KY-GH-1]QEY16567.1 hypothetical protein D0C16_11585 [Cellvibrio sp. KY-GH-1]